MDGIEERQVPARFKRLPAGAATAFSKLLRPVPRRPLVVLISVNWGNDSARILHETLFAYLNSASDLLL